MQLRAPEAAQRRAELIELATERSGVPHLQAEKDFWLTEVLRGTAAAAAEVGIQVVFKGGTSLSKAYGLIERFSEDVDASTLMALLDADGNQEISWQEWSHACAVWLADM